MCTGSLDHLLAPLARYLKGWMAEYYESASLAAARWIAAGQPAGLCIGEVIAPPEYFEYSATMCSAFFFLSPVVQMKQVYMSKGSSLGAVNPSTMIMLFFNCSLWTAWGVYLPMPPAIPGNVLGLCCSSCYLLFCWSHVGIYKCALPVWNRRALMGTISAVLGSAFLTTYAAISPITAGHIGTIAMVICIFLFAAPLTVVAQVLSDKSSELLPPVQCLMQFLNCGFWLIVGLNKSAFPVITCNSLGFMLASVQLGLIAIYPQRKAKTEVV